MEVCVQMCVLPGRYQWRGLSSSRCPQPGLSLQSVKHHTHTLLFTLQVKVCYLRSVCVFSTNPVFSWQTVELHLTAAGSVGEIHIRPSFLFLPVHSCIVTSDIWNRRQTFTTMTHSLTTEQFFVKNCTSYKKTPQKIVLLPEYMLSAVILLQCSSRYFPLPGFIHSVPLYIWEIMCIICTCMCYL